MRIVGRILLAAVVADVVGLLIISVLAFAHAPVSSVLGMVPFVLFFGGMLAVPAAIVGVLVGDMIAPARGYPRGMAFVVLGAVIGSFLGTPLVGGPGGAAAGLVASLGADRNEEPQTRAGMWARIAAIVLAGLLCVMLFSSLFGGHRLPFRIF